MTGSRTGETAVTSPACGAAALAHGPLDLRAVVAGARDAEVPALLGALEEARAECWRRVVAPAATPAVSHPGGENDLLFTIPDVARRLAVRVDYAYALARQGKLPVVRLPGLEKGGRQRDGKQIRVRADALREWIRAHEREKLEE